MLCFCKKWLSSDFQKRRLPGSNVFVIPYKTISSENMFLSYDVAVIQWIMSCHKNRMTTRVITLWRVDVKSLTTSVSTMHFLIKILSILKAIKYTFKGSSDKQNLTLVVISYEIYETRHRLVS